MISCIAIEDEPLALKQIETYIAKTPFLKFMGGFTNAFDAIEILNSGEVQLLFLDINMPDINGVEFFKSLVTRPSVIFTTAYSEYALDGFKLDAIDYLLKPFSYAEFMKAALKAQSWLEAKTPIPAEEKDEGFIFVKADYKLVKIAIDDIVYIEGMKEYVRIHLKSSKPVMTLMSMKKLEEILPAQKFMRVHKSYIVNLTKIEMVDKSRILFGDSYVPVSEQYKEKFTNYLQSHLP